METNCLSIRVRPHQLDFHRGLGPAGEKPTEELRGAAAAGPVRPVPPPLLPERDQWAEREREMEKRERTRAEREWDRDKVRDFSKPGEEREAGARRSRSRDRERRRKERGKSKEKKTDKKGEKFESPQLLFVLWNIIIIIIIIIITTIICSLLLISKLYFYLSIYMYICYK